MNIKILLLKLIIFVILLWASNYYLKNNISSAYKDYYIECEKCVNSQTKLIEALQKYKNEEEDTNLTNIVENDCKFNSKMLFEKGYLKELVVGAEKECDYRYDISTSKLYCVTHGDLEFVQDYYIYKRSDNQDKSLCINCYMMGITVLLLNIIF